MEGENERCAKQPGTSPMKGEFDANIDQREREQFDQVADSWWDPEGPFKALHELNPVRLKYILERSSIKGSSVLDVGCGGGILTESLAAAGGVVTGIDIAPRALGVARLHLLESGMQADYREVTVEHLAAEDNPGYDVITCMEMLEHVPDPGSVLHSIAHLLKPGGQVFVSTINRTPAAFLLAIVGAEYVARILPRGTHRYERFISPSELCRCLRAAGLAVQDIRGIHYDPLARYARLGGSVRVNYLVHASG